MIFVAQIRKLKVRFVNSISRIVIPAIISASAPISAEQIAVNYYGVVSKTQEVDSNMLKMAQDIFFTQLKSIESVAVEDCRPDTSKVSAEIPQFFGESIALYAQISESEKDGSKVWKCTFSAFNPSDEITHSKTETYDSYYKILAGAKSAIESVLAGFHEEPKIVVESPKQEEKTFRGNIDIESMAGTWGGEPYTDKILILRGGRGFIIFKNGATMNIKIVAKKFDSSGNVSEIEVRQVGKSNASFFPELPRQTALNLAATASPIKWTFEIRAGELYGTKQTLIPAANEIGAVEGTVDSVWSKR